MEPDREQSTGHENFPTLQTTIQNTLLVPVSNLSSKLAPRGIGRGNVFGPVSLYIDCGSHISDKTIAELTAEQKRALKAVRDHNGSRQGLCRQLDLVSSRLVEKDFENEHTDSWVGAYQLVNKNKEQKIADVSGSHVVYKIKHDSEEHRYLKVRICHYGSEDVEKDDIRKDYNNAPMATLRLIITLTAIWHIK